MDFTERLGSLWYETLLKPSSPQGRQPWSVRARARTIAVDGVTLCMAPESIEHRPAGNLNRYLSLSLGNVKPPRKTSTAPGKKRLRDCAVGTKEKIHTRAEEWNTAVSAREVQTEWSEAKLHVGKILIHFCDRIPQLSSPSLKEVDLNLNCLVPVLPGRRKSSGESMGKVLKFAATVPTAYCVTA